MPILNLPDTIEIPFETLTNEQRSAIHTVMSGEGLTNPLTNKIEQCEKLCDIELEVLNNTTCSAITPQNRLELTWLLETLKYELNVFKIHTNKLSGSSINYVDIFFQRLSTAGTYTNVMKSITGLDKERYSFIFHSIMGAGDRCLNRILQDFHGNCESGEIICDKLSSRAGISGLVQGACNSPSLVNPIVSCFIKGLTDCLKNARKQDDINYCKARDTIDKYSASLRISKDAVEDPLLSHIIKGIFATPLLKQALLDIQNSNELSNQTSQFFPEFEKTTKRYVGATLGCCVGEYLEISVNVNEDGTIETETIDCLGAPLVIVGPDGQQGVKGTDGLDGNTGMFGAPGATGECFYEGEIIKGACCIEEYCHEIMEEHCAFYGGIWYGDNTLCAVMEDECRTSEPPCQNHDDCPIVGGKIQACCGNECVDACTYGILNGGDCPDCPPCDLYSDCTDGCGDGPPCTVGYVCCPYSGYSHCTPECPGGGCPNCQGTCCPPGHSCCGDDGCCESGKCCNVGSGIECCGDGHICCGNVCWEQTPEQFHCCNDGAHYCPENENCCGDGCCEGECCQGTCCHHGICCGGDCCPASKPHCCNGQCFGGCFDKTDQQSIGDCLTGTQCDRCEWGYNQWGVEMIIGGCNPCPNCYTNSETSCWSENDGGVPTNTFCCCGSCCSGWYGDGACCEEDECCYTMTHSSWGDSEGNAICESCEEGGVKYCPQCPEGVWGSVSGPHNSNSKKCCLPELGRNLCGDCEYGKCCDTSQNETCCDTGLNNSGIPTYECCDSLSRCCGNAGCILKTEDCPTCCSGPMNSCEDCDGECCGDGCENNADCGDALCCSGDTTCKTSCDAPFCCEGSFYTDPCDLCGDGSAKGKCIDCTNKSNCDCPQPNTRCSYNSNCGEECCEPLDIECSTCCGGWSPYNPCNNSGGCACGNDQTCCGSSKATWPDGIYTEWYTCCEDYEVCVGVPESCLSEGNIEIKECCNPETSCCPRCECDGQICCRCGEGAPFCTSSCAACEPCLCVIMDDPDDNPEGGGGGGRNHDELECEHNIDCQGTDCCIDFVCQPCLDFRPEPPNNNNNTLSVSDLDGGYDDTESSNGNTTNFENPCKENTEFCVNKEGEGNCCNEGEYCCNGECYKSNKGLGGCCYSDVTEEYYYCPYGCCEFLGGDGSVVCNEPPNTNAENYYSGKCPPENTKKSNILKFEEQRTYSSVSTNISTIETDVGKTFNDGVLTGFSVNIKDKPVIGNQDSLSVDVPLTTKPTVITTPVKFQIVNFAAADGHKEFTRTSLSGNTKDTQSKISANELKGNPNIALAGFESTNGVKAKAIKGSLTANIRTDGIISESQVITFVSGSNIRLDTNEHSDFIRISVDDLNLWELLDVDDDSCENPQKDDYLQYDGTSNKWKAKAVLEGPEGPIGPTGPRGGNYKEILFYDEATDGPSGSPDFTFDVNTNVFGVTSDTYFYSGFAVGDDCNFENNIIEQAALKNYSETVSPYYSVYISSHEINCNIGNIHQIKNMYTADKLTLSITNAATAGSGSISLILSDAATGGGITWPSGTVWSGGVEPTLSSSGTDIITLTTTNGGTSWYGFVGGIGFS